LPVRSWCNFIVGTKKEFGKNGVTRTNEVAYDLGTPWYSTPESMARVNDRETRRSEEARIVSYYKNQLTSQEIESDISRYVGLVIEDRNAPRGTINGINDLRTRAKKIFGTVKNEVITPDGYDLARCIDTLWFENLDRLSNGKGMVGGVTRVDPAWGPPPVIYINEKLQNDATLGDHCLAHEAAHARLYDPETNSMDGSEWLEQLVGMETSLKLSKDLPNKKAVEGEVADHLLQGAIGTLVMKLKAEGKSGDEIGSYLKNKFRFTDECLNHYVTWSTDSPYVKEAKRREMDTLCTYEFVPYVGMKLLQSGSGGNLKYSYGQRAMDLHLDTLKAWKPERRPQGSSCMYDLMITEARYGNQVSPSMIIDASSIKYRPPAGGFDNNKQQALSSSYCVNTLHKR